jgi:hypothetical protein
MSVNEGIIWVHEDAISLDHPVVAAAGPGAQPIFIWDSHNHDALGYSLKRRVFIFECALDLDIPIYAGTPQAILREVANGRAIYAATSPDPYITQVLIELQKDHEVVPVDARPFARIASDVDTRRFFRFWNQAKKTAMLSTQELEASQNTSRDDA